MNPESVSLFGFIALRALAEFNPAEYRRASDLSRRDLDRRINELLAHSEDREAIALHEDFERTISSARSENEAAFLLRNLYLISIAKMQSGSIALRHDIARLHEHENTMVELPLVTEVESHLGDEHEQLLRLAVMRILRDLRNYSASFHKRIGRFEVDAILEPRTGGLPLIVVESKPYVRSRRPLEAAEETANALRDSLGSQSHFLLITRAVSSQVQRISRSESVVLLRFNLRDNNFAGQEYLSFLEQLGSILETRGDDPRL